jgi:hypothetical protein
MADKIEGKRIPWQQFEEYVALHQENIVTLQKSFENKLTDKPDIERMLPKSLYQIHELLSKILRDNGIL